MQNFDIIIKNGIVLTMDATGRQIRSGAVGVSGDTIVAVDSAGAADRWTAERVIDARSGIVLPGLVNTHTHLPMSLFRGLADDLPLMEWLNRYIFPAEAAHINPDSVRLGTLLSCAEMLLSGTTCCCDGYFHEEAVADAVREVGLRAVVGQGVIDFPAPGVPDPAENVTHAARFVDRVRGMSDRIYPSVFCHSPYTCSERTLKAAKDAADERGVLFQIHVAETEDEVNQIRSRHGVTPVAYLDRLGILDPHTLAIHAVWVTEADIEILARRGVGISHNPGSNMKLASGLAPAASFIQAKIPVGLGTDGCASNNNLDLFGEMDTAAKLGKIRSLDPTAMDAHTVLRMATIDGARAIGLDDRIGSIEVGKQADLIIVDTAKPHLVPMYDPVSHIVFAMQGADVRDVLIGGDWVVRQGRLQTLEIGPVMAKVNRLAREIQKTTGISRT